MAPLPPQRRNASLTLTRFAGRAGDHNDRAMVASALLATAFAEAVGIVADEVHVIGEAEPALLSTDWRAELQSALPTLEKMSQQYGDIFSLGRIPVTALSRCAVALSTLPVVAAHRPDAVVVWFDAHADLNTPAETTTGYLGGLALSGPLGLWESGLGAGVKQSNTVLVGARDIDPPEQALIDDSEISWVPIGPTMPEHLHEVVAGRPVYVHIDCDVLDGGIVPTDYCVPAGMTIEQLRACAVVLAQNEVVGLEVGELEVDPSDSTGPHDRGHADLVVEALSPLLAKISAS